MDLIFMAAFYRSLLICLLVLLLGWFFLPWEFAYNNGSIAALSWLGAGSMISREAIIVYSNLITLAYVVTYIGLFFFQRWARIALIAILLLGGLGISLFGISVQSSYEAMLGYFATLGDGFILALAFFSNIRAKFR